MGKVILVVLKWGAPFAFVVALRCGLVYREVLTGRRLFMTSVEVASTVGLVRRRSRLKGVFLAVLSGVSNSPSPVLGIPKW